MNKAVHHCTVIYFALIILIRMMAMPISLMNYSLNKDFIARNLCENRLRLAIHCSGMCFLNKQLTRANDGQNPQDQKGTVKILIIDFFESLDQSEFSCTSLLTAHAFAVNTKHKTENYRDHFFRPPIA